MEKLRGDLANLQAYFSANYAPEQRSAAQTAFLKKLSELTHAHYRGKMQTLPKAGIWDFNWFNVWYTPGVSAVSTSIRDGYERSYELSNRGNLVAVVSDSTRVLGDGDCGPAGGLGVMEGKAMLMKYLGGFDALALCVNNRGEDGKPDPARLIDFVRMLAPSVGAVNLEDISQPNCYRVLDELRESCGIPVWHDDAQGTACVTLAGLLNALELAVETTPLQNAELHITLEIAQESIQKRSVIYDKSDDAHYDTISAFIKSVRGSDPDAALYWLAKMLHAGEDPRFILRRLIILASEDIGLADPRGILVANAAAQNFEYIGLPEGCLLYTSDAADDLLCVDFGGRRIIKKKRITKTLEQLEK